MAAATITVPPDEMPLASSYRGKATSPSALSLDLERLPDLRDRHVLVVDDIFDTGRTLAAIIDRIGDAQPASVRGAVLLWKDRARETEWEPHYLAAQSADDSRSRPLTLPLLSRPRARRLWP